YTYVTDLVGEIVKADSNKLTLRVTWFVPQQQGNNNVNHRPPLSGNHRNFRNPYATNMNRPQHPPHITLKEQHHDYELEFVPESLVRIKPPPPKTNENGRGVASPTKEPEEARVPPPVVVSAPPPGALNPAPTAGVGIVRKKSTPAAKATEDDL